MIVFRSSLDAAQRLALERLLFFNENQHVSAVQVTDTASTFGAPSILEHHGKVSLKFRSGAAPQTLFAVCERGPRADVVGVVVFTRLGDVLRILFVAVHEDYASNGRYSSQLLLLRIIREVRAVGRRIKGVSRVTVTIEEGREVELST